MVFRLIFSTAFTEFDSSLLHLTGKSSACIWLLLTFNNGFIYSESLILKNYTMKKLIILMIAVTASLITFSQETENKKPETTQQVKYDCPMHPDVVSDKPAQCSKCGMDLVKIKKGKKEMNYAYNCPMHKDITSTKPGKCSKCKMDLKKSGKEKMLHAYSCPMHADVTSDKPSKCNKCGMNLKKSVTYSCPMHPEVTGTKKGACSKCGMDLEEQK